MGNRHFRSSSPRSCQTLHPCCVWYHSGAAHRPACLGPRGHLAMWATQMFGLRREAGLCLYFFPNDFLFYFLFVLVIHEHMLIFENLNNSVSEYIAVLLYGKYGVRAVHHSRSPAPLPKRDRSQRTCSALCRHTGAAPRLPPLSSSTALL